MNNQKGFSPILIVLITLAVLVFIWILITQGSANIGSEGTISSMKTYKHEESGLTFKYPAVYSDNGGYEYFSIISPVNPDKPSHINYITEDELKLELIINENTNDLTLQEFFDKECASNNGNILSTEKTNLAGVNTIVQIWELEGDGETYCFINNGYTFRLMKYPINPQRSDQFSQILSTFEFVE